jgi:hypothetical protein
MITITNTIKTPITGALQKLPINKYLIFEAGDHLTESLEQSDVLLLDVKTAQQMRKMDTATLSLCAILLYVETEEMSAGTYELAKEIGVHAIFSNADMKKLQLLIDQAYDPKGKALESCRSRAE